MPREQYILRLSIQLLFFFLLVTPLPASSAALLTAAEQDELKIFLDEIQHASDTVNSFSCGFTQERNLALFTDPVVFHGSLIIARPDRLRWEFNQPLPSVLIFSGEQGMRCSGNAPPVRFELGSDPVMQTVARQLWLWLGGDYTRLEELYILEKAGPSTLLIHPDDDAVAEYIDSVSITFSSEAKQPEKVEIREPGGDSTIITFHSCAFNNFPPDILFSTCETNE